MTVTTKRRLRAALLCITAAALVLLPLTAAQEKKPEPSAPAAEQAQEAAQASAPAEYIGSETCQACHEDIFKAFQTNPHQIVEKQSKRGWEGKACESCHGPGSKHAETASAEDIFNPSKAPAGHADQSCLKCHLNEPTHIGRIQSGHAKGQVACASCHSIHKTREAMVARRPAAINQQCASCHTSAWAEFNRPHSHRLREGAMSCVDCHNPHGSLFPRMMQTVSANEPGCLKCHSDKRGPFVFEHAPVKLEGCATCHEAHGSANPRMLTRHEVRFQCMECHSNLAAPQPVGDTQVAGGVPPAFHNLLSPRFRNCTICHIKVHGSNVNRDFLR
jgi:DmsE family decaheme c-type cytochrome